MAPRNFGNRSSDMARAASNALYDAANRREISYQTARDYGQRFGQFVRYAKTKFGVTRLERITRNHLVSYGKELSQQVRDGDLSAAHAQGLISAANKAIEISSHGQVELRVSPTKECGIVERSFVRDTPTLSYTDARSAIEAIRAQGLAHAASVAELGLELGLRSKEASLLDARASLSGLDARALAQGKPQQIKVFRGTKGGKERSIPITNDKQIAALQRAAEVQASSSNIVPAGQSYKQWVDRELREGRNVLRDALGLSRGGYHELRSGYAAARYEQLTGGHAAPCNGGSAPKTDDRSARKQIARELGHERAEITNEYLGGRR